MHSFTSFFILLFALLSQILAQSSATLTVKVTDVQQQGRVYVAVFTADSDFPNGQDFLQTKNCAVTGASATISFDLPPGTYAVSVYQDLDDDQKHDKNFLGIPTEPFCFSRNYRPGLSAPDFEDCAFALPHSGQSLSLKLID